MADFWLDCWVLGICWLAVSLFLGVTMDHKQDEDDNPMECNCLCCQYCRSVVDDPKYSDPLSDDLANQAAMRDIFRSIDDQRKRLSSLWGQE